MLDPKEVMFSRYCVLLYLSFLVEISLPTKNEEINHPQFNLLRLLFNRFVPT